MSNIVSLPETTKVEIPINFAVLWILMLIIVIGVIIKFGPKVVKFFDSLRKQVNHIESIIEATAKNAEQIERIEKMLNKQQAHLDELDRIQKLQNAQLADSLDERELILKSLLGVIQGLQEIGANGPTKQAEKDIQDYLLQKSHNKCGVPEMFPTPTDKIG